MSTRSLGSLTLDLIARVGGFKSGMDQAARIADNRSRDIKNSVSRNVSSGFESANQSIQGFTKNIIGIAAVWKGVQSSFASMESWTNLNNRIRVVTNGAEEFKLAQDELIRVSLATRQSLSATAEMYQRIAQNQKELGLSGQEVIDIVETIGKAMATSGSEVSAARGALIQLGQAFASGELRGQELNSVMEQAGPLAKAIADGLGIGIGELRRMAKEGETDISRIIEALNKQAGTVDENFQKMDVSMGQAMTNLATQSTVAVGRFSDATGAAKTFASAILTLSENLPVAAAAVGSFASVQIAKNLSERAKALAANRVELIASTRAELAKAQAVELQTRAAMLNAQAEAARAKSIGGSVALNAQAAQATLAHRQATVALTAAQVNAAAATNVLGGALKSTMAFLGGPLGIGLMVASVGASWLMFRDNTKAADRALIDLGGTVSDVTDKFRELNRQQQAGEILRINREIASSYDDIVDSVRQIRLNLAVGGASDVNSFLDEAESLADKFKKGELSADEFSASIDAASSKVKSAGGITKQYAERVTELKSELAASAREYERQNGILDSFRGAQNDAANAVDDTTDALKRQEAALKAGQAELSKFIGDIPAKINQATIAITRAQRGEFAAIQAEVGQMTMAAGGVANLKPEDRAAINQYLNLQKELLRVQEEQEKLKNSRKNSESEAKKLADSYSNINSQLAERIALFGQDGEAARLAYQLEHGELKKLTDAQKEALMVQARKIDQLDKEREAQDELNEARKREVDDMLQWKSNIEDMLADLEFEYELLKMTNEQREIATALRYANVEAMSEEGQMIAEAIKRNQELAQSQADTINAMDSVRNAGADLFVDFSSGAKSFKESMLDALNSIRDRMLSMIAENLMDQLLGQRGTSQAGSAGGFFANLFSSMFKGGRAGGGSVAPNSMYRVNETGMEMVSVGGRDYLMTGGQSGIVSAAGGDMSVRVQPKVEINIENQTGAAMDTSNQSVNFDGEKWVIGIVAKAVGSGKLDRQFGSAFGVRRQGYSGA